MTSGNPNPTSAAAAHSFTIFDETALLARIGSNLRDLYGDVEASTPPSDLLLLASLIDGKRQAEGEDGTAT